MMLPMTILDQTWPKRYRPAAISLIIVLLIISGCATKQDVIRVEEKVGQVRNNQILLRSKLDKIDSLIVESTEQDNRLRVEVRTTLEELMAQLNQVQSQMNELQQMVYRVSQEVGNSESSHQPIVSITPSDTVGVSGDTAAPTPEVPSVDCNLLWDNSFKDMMRGQYDLAISGFTDYLKFCPQGRYADNCQYWIAEAYYEMKSWERAIEEYNRFLTSYPDSEKLPTAYFKLGRSHEEMGDTKKALEYFLVLKNEYPETLEFEQVKDKIETYQK